MIKHYKELNPEETIKKLKDILEENRIIACKQTAGNALNSLYSCRVGINDTPVGVNGKGITEELSLASGLAELLERLQNQVLVSPYEISPDAMKKFGFIYDVYEKLLPSSQYPPLPEDFKKGHLYVYNCSTGDLWDKYREYMADKNREFPFIPYYNVNEDKLEYLPYRFFWYIYSTNGMCGGNSPQEALTQGMCEIFERHVQAEIYFRELTPPTIPHEYFKEHATYQYNLIKMLEDTGFYKIIVKDCSLGLGFPVIGTVVIFKDKNKYAFKFGSDPDMAIALERCLTEFFQGRRIFYDDLLAPINTVPVFDKEEYERLYLWYTTRGYGHCSHRIFDNEFSYEFKGFPSVKCSNQTERFNSVKDLVRNMGYNIFVRDVSFLGFNSYQIIIPGLSEEFFNHLKWDMLVRSIPRMNYLSRLDKLNNTELKELSVDMESFLSFMRREGEKLYLLGEYAPAPYVFEENPLNKMSLNVFMTYLYYNLRDFDKAYKSYCEFVDGLARECEALPRQLHALREFLALSKEYPENLEKIRDILIGIYDDYIIDDILATFKDTDNLVRNVVNYDLNNDLLNCWNCEKCTVLSICPYKYIEQVYLNVKEKASKHPIDQMSLKSLFYNCNL